MSLETILAAGDASEDTVTGALEGPPGTLDTVWEVQLTGMTKDLPRAARSSTAREFVGLLASAKAVLARAADAGEGPRILVYFTDNAATAMWSIKARQPGEDLGGGFGPAGHAERHGRSMLDREEHFGDL